MTTSSRRLIDLIRKGIESGTLPREASTSVDGAQGMGSMTCACCAEVIGFTDRRYTVSDPKGRELRMHLHCYGLWYSITRAAAAQRNVPDSSD